MSKFIPNKEHLRKTLIFCFHLKKTAAESYRLLREAYGEHALSQDTCERWFRHFKSGDFDVADKKRGKPQKKYEDVELQALLDEDDSQTQEQLAKQLGVSQQAVSNRLREMGMIQKNGRWVPHEFTNCTVYEIADESSEATDNSDSSPKHNSASKKAPMAKIMKLYHPKTAEMVNEAIKELAERNGSSLVAIKKFITERYNVDMEKQALFIKKYLKEAVANGTLVQTKGKGASGSFKMPSAKVLAAQLKEPKSAKAAARKTVSKEPINTEKSKKSRSENTMKVSPTKKQTSRKTGEKTSTADSKSTTAKAIVTKTAAKSSSKAKKMTKSPTNKPKAPRPKKSTAAPKSPKLTKK